MSRPTVTGRVRTSDLVPLKVRREDKITLHIKLEIPATDLVADREWAYKDAVKRAKGIIRRQLDLIEVS